MTDTGAIAAYYDSQVADEWERLTLNWLEFGVTWHMVKRDLPEAARILDVGGGPGRYALSLAAGGHHVDLLDLSSSNIAFARYRAREQGLALASAEWGDARDLSAYPSGHYDCVLVLGPLYHLVEVEEKRQAIEEALRVLKPGGQAFFAFISRYAPFHFNAKRRPGEIAAWRGLSDRIFERGFYRPQADERFFVEASFVDPDWIDPFMTGFDQTRVRLFGAESLFAQSEAVTVDLPQAARAAWLDLAISYAETKAALFASEHLVYVARKER